MRRLLAILRRHRAAQTKPAFTGRPLPPIRIGADGCIDLNTATTQRLEHLHSLGYLYREQLEAAEAECCELFGIDPNSPSIEADLCRQIITNGMHVPKVIELIADRRRQIQSFLD